MHAVIARFPAASDHREAMLAALDASLVITQEQPGFLAYQVLAPSQGDPLRVCLLLWESKAAFKAFLGSDASRRAHADVRPEYFSETPGIEELDVLSTWHAPAVTT